jgi:hypothetical protein
MHQESPSADQVRQRRYQFGMGTLALFVIACAGFLALYRSLGYESALLFGLLATAWHVTRRWRRVPRVALLTVAALGAYFAAYYLSLWGKTYIVIELHASGIGRCIIEPKYFGRSPVDTDSYLGPYPGAFFGPALWVDRHVVRREYWRTVENRAAGKKWRLTKLGWPEPAVAARAFEAVAKAYHRRGDAVAASANQRWAVEFSKDLDEKTRATRKAVLEEYKSEADQVP